MREFKFRFWNADQLHWESPSLMEFTRRRVDDDQIGVPFNLNSDNIVIQQFTGLIDKNGNDIYEGDILYVQPADEQSGWCKSVIFENGGFTFNSWLLGTEFAKIPVEVIGNIFENPELIKT